MSVKEKIFDFLKALGPKLWALLMIVYNYLKHVAEFIGEMTTGGFLVTQTELAHGEPLGGNDSLSEEIKELAVKERDLLITENMDVQGTNGPYCNIKGIELLLSGTDTMRFYLADRLVCKIWSNRDEPGFTVYRGTTGDTIGKVEKIGDDYGFFPEPSAVSTESTETTKLTTEPAYKLEGDFINRRFLMKNAKGENVAKIKKQVIAFPAFDHYVVRVAPGMDPILVLVCLCVIDEDLEDQIKDAALYLPKKVVGVASDAVLFVPKKAVGFLSAYNPFGSA